MTRRPAIERQVYGGRQLHIWQSASERPLENPAQPLSSPAESAWLILQARDDLKEATSYITSERNEAGPVSVLNAILAEELERVRGECCGRRPKPRPDERLEADTYGRRASFGGMAPLSTPSPRPPSGSRVLPAAEQLPSGAGRARRRTRSHTSAARRRSCAPPASRRPETETTVETACSECRGGGGPRRKWRRPGMTVLPAQVTASRVEYCCC